MPLNASYDMYEDMSRGRGKMRAREKAQEGSGVEEGEKDEKMVQERNGKNLDCTWTPPR